MQRLARLAQSLLASAESTEVLDCLGDEVRVQLHVDAAKRLAAQRDVEEDTGPCGLGLGFRSHSGDVVERRGRKSVGVGAISGKEGQLNVRRIRKRKNDKSEWRKGEIAMPKRWRVVAWGKKAAKIPSGSLGT